VTVAASGNADLWRNSSYFLYMNEAPGILIRPPCRRLRALWGESMRRPFVPIRFCRGSSQCDRVWRQARRVSPNCQPGGRTRTSARRRKRVRLLFGGELDGCWWQLRYLERLGPVSFSHTRSRRPMRWDRRVTSVQRQIPGQSRSHVPRQQLR